MSQRLRLVRVLLDMSEPALDETPDIEEAWENEITERIEAVRNGLAGSPRPTALDDHAGAHLTCH